MMRRSVIAAACLVAVARGSENIILEPVTDDAALPEKMLLLMHGGLVSNDHYKVTAEAIQESLNTTVRLWVVMPATWFNMCISQCPSPRRSLCWPLKNTVEGALNEAEEKGWKRNDEDGKSMDGKNLWIAGHSLGSVCASYLVTAYHTEAEPAYAGALLWAATTGSAGVPSMREYPIPVAMMQGEVDGLRSVRPSTSLPYWDAYQDAVRSLGEERATKEKLMLVLPGLNHSSWCPSFAVPMDLNIGDWTKEEATARIGEASGSFIAANSPELAEEVRRTELLSLQEMVNYTSTVMNPVRTAHRMKEDFCKEAQKDIAGVYDDSLVVEVMHFFDDVGHLGRCEPQSEKLANGKALVKICGAYDGDVFDDDDDDTVFACRFVARDRIETLLGRGVNRSAGDCAAAIEGSMRVARELASFETTNRYDMQSKRAFVVERPDRTPWLGRFRGVDMDLEEDEEGIFIKSVRRQGGNGQTPWIDCKLVRPSLALDWLMTEGFRPDELEERDNDWIPYAIIALIIALIICCFCTGCCDKRIYPKDNVAEKKLPLTGQRRDPVEEGQVALADGTQSQKSLKSVVV